MTVARNIAVVAGVTVCGCGFHPSGDAPGVDAITGPPADGPIVDAIEVDGRAVCPVEYVAGANGRYVLRTTEMTAAQAREDCEDDLPGRTHLATYEDETTFDREVDVVGPDEQAIVFIGGVCSSSVCDERNVWFWSTGPAVHDSLWPMGQPNQGSTQHALATQQVSGIWVLNNIEEELTQPYICECDP